MGIEGAVLAVGALFLLAYVVPHITRKRAVLADAPIGERYSNDLRLITERTLRQASGEHGKIFTTERIMSTPSGKRGQRSPNASKMRAIARDRSRARARIAQRGATQQRALLGAAVLVGLTVVLWILAGVTSVPTALAIASTAVGGVYLVGLGAVVSSWSRLNDEDEERISRANHALYSSRKYQRELDARMTNDAEPEAPGVGPAKTVVVAPAKTTGHAAKKSDVESAAPVVENPSVKALRSLPIQPVKRERPARPVAETTVSQEPSARVEVPSYTLKPTIQRRSVKPYVAPEVPEADVPYRPSQIGERLGEESLEAANPAPEMTRAEELRSDVLGAGSTLDALLDRRRA